MQGVTLQAVAKLVSALEVRTRSHSCSSAAVADFNSPLMVRSTPKPAPRCWRNCRRPTTGLRQARQRPQGTLVVGGTPFLIQHCIVPGLPSFHASYPDLTLDLRAVLAPG
jgi:LysR family transcriptional regulator for bpeEF and oprC